MTVVYIREQDAIVRKRGEQIIVTQGEAITLRIPLANLDQLVLMGNAQMTTQAAAMLLKNDIDVVLMSKYGKFRGRLLATQSKYADMRLRQLRLCDNPQQSLKIARGVVIGKITNQRVVLQRRFETGRETRRTLDGMLKMQRAAEQARDLDQLRGYEGKAGAFYFEGMRTLFEPEWGFKTREYYPPPDPANCLLSFAYTLLLKDVEAKIQLVGLDPYLGFFHALGYNRPALALDLMEEFRPSIADIVVLTLVRGGQITLDDFVVTGKPEMPVRMSDQAISILVAAYEERLEDRVLHPLANGQTRYRNAIELQVRQMARIVRSEADDYAALELK